MKLRGDLFLSNWQKLRKLIAVFLILQRILWFVKYNDILLLHLPSLYYWRYTNSILVYVYGVTPLSTIVHLYRGGQIFWWSKPEYPEKTTHLSQGTDAWPWTGVELTTLVVINTDCTGSCKANYHMTTSTKTPKYFYCVQIRCSILKIPCNENK